MTSRKQPPLLEQTPETPRLRWEGVTCSPEPPTSGTLSLGPVLSNPGPGIAPGGAWARGAPLTPGAQQSSRQISLEYEVDTTGIQKTHAQKQSVP